MDMTKPKTFSGKKLKAAREHLGLNMSDLARQIRQYRGRFTRFHANSVRNHEQGEARVDMDTAVVYAEILTEGNLDALME